MKLILRETEFQGPPHRDCGGGLCENSYDVAQTKKEEQSTQDDEDNRNFLESHGWVPTDGCGYGVSTSVCLAFSKMIATRVMMVAVIPIAATMMNSSL